jgi:hypothetical protein
MAMAMAIELNQIHNVVRTYQWAIQLSPPAQQESEQAGYVGEDQISISLDAHERNNIHLVNEVFNHN